MNKTNITGEFQWIDHVLNDKFRSSKDEKYAKVMQNGNMQARITDNESELCDQNEEVPLSLGGWYSE